MNSKSLDVNTVLTFLGITAAAALVWTGFLFLLWSFLRSNIGTTTGFWTMLTAASTALAAAAVFGAAFIAYRELSEMASSRHIEVADRLFEELNSPENVESRRWVFQKLPSDPVEGIKAMDEKGQAHVKRVLNSLDHVAFLTQANWIPDDIIMPWMHPMIFKSWEKLEAYVKYERDRRCEPYYYAHGAWLAERCKTWRRINLPDAKTVWVEDAL